MPSISIHDLTNELLKNDLKLFNYDFYYKLGPNAKFLTTFGTTELSKLFIN